MDLKNLYEQLYKNSIESFKNNNFEYDSLIDSNNDNRYGITLIIRPSENIKQNILEVQNTFKHIDNKQYFYPAEDLHITVLSIIVCHDNFSLDQINLNPYIELFEKSLAETKSFKINFSGITASPSCFMVQGFPENDYLNKIRNNIKNHFQNSDIYNSIDKRYSLKTSHITFLRFKSPVENSDEIITTLEANHHIEFGESEIKEIEFVFNDWYMKKHKTLLLKKFSLISESN